MCWIDPWSMSIWGNHCASLYSVKYLSHSSLHIIMYIIYIYIYIQHHAITHLLDGMVQTFYAIDKWIFNNDPFQDDWWAHEHLVSKLSKICWGLFRWWDEQREWRADIWLSSRCRCRSSQQRKGSLFVFLECCRPLLGGLCNCSYGVNSGKWDRNAEQSRYWKCCIGMGFDLRDAILKSSFLIPFGM